MRKVPKLRTGRRGLALAGATVALAATTMTPASASTLSAGGWTFQSGLDCEATGASLETTNGSAMAQGATYWGTAGAWCSRLTISQTYEHIAEIIYYKWVSSPSGGQWALCLNSGVYYNPSPTYVFTITTNGFSTPPCGAGYYDVLGASYHLFGGTYWGGPVVTGYTYFPASAPAKNDSASNKPSPMKADNTFGTAKSPTRIAVVGKNGAIVGYTRLPSAPSLSSIQAAHKARSQHGTIIRKPDGSINIVVSLRSPL